MMDLVSQPQGEYLLPHAPKSSHFFRYSTNWRIYNLIICFFYRSRGAAGYAGGCQPHALRAVVYCHFFYFFRFTVPLYSLRNLIVCFSFTGREAPPDMLEGFNLTLYKRIVTFKTAYYTFYLVSRLNDWVLAHVAATLRVDKTHTHTPTYSRINCIFTFETAYYTFYLLVKSLGFAMF
jgi:hypothetical protein